MYHYHDENNDMQDLELITENEHNIKYDKIIPSDRYSTADFLQINKSDSYNIIEKEKSTLSISKVEKSTLLTPEVCALICKLNGKRSK